METNVTGSHEQYSNKFFGHPRGLATLFFTEMWERFSFYGMRGILVLYMIAAMTGFNKGMGMSSEKATAIYGLYMMSVYLFSLPGGWVADKILGLRKSVWYGGILIACGHFSMAIPTNQTFFLGLVLIVLGTGLLKPNVSSMVGGLYANDSGARRDAGFSIFYMGINLGAMIAPLVCGYLGENVNWHYGFGAAGVGMLIGLIQYKVTDKYLGDIGLEVEKDPHVKDHDAKLKKNKRTLYIVVGIIAVIVFAALVGILPINPVLVGNWSIAILLFVFLFYFTYLLVFSDLDPKEKKKVGAIIILSIFSVIFWFGAEQAGSSLNIFADVYTHRTFFGWLMPASWLQSVNPAFIIIFAPIFGWLWVWLNKRNLEPSSPVKFAMGLILLGAGFFVMVIAAEVAMAHMKASVVFLVTYYLLETFGELSLSPVGLSTVTKLAPKRLVGQMMGIWFLSTGLAEILAGRFAGNFNQHDVHMMPHLFTIVVVIGAGSGILLLLISKPVRKLMQDVH
ncbi:MAG TPA: peptide MFS transporter [Balneolaceae bacterium]|nr:peptide MFS transporter [Balneolaceae bacterium]